jgi:hypothetical protein
VNIALEVGGVSETVEVTAEAPLVDTTTGATRVSFEPEFVDKIPLNSRNAYAMLRLVPGSSSDWSGTGIGGLDATKVDSAIDGSISQDTWNMKTIRTPPPDSLKEFTVTNSYSAEFGRNGGPVVLMTTQSGTNSLHGSVYDYFRAENLNANSFQSNYYGRPKSDFKQHNPGFTVGGPVYLPWLYDGRNKTFFFVGFQDLRQPAAPYLWGRGGLTAAELAGDFSQSKIIPVVSKSAAIALNSPFAGMEGQKLTNLAPYLSPSAVRLYKYFQMPLVAKSGDRSFQNERRNSYDRTLTLRGDHNFAQKNNLSISYIHQEQKVDPSYNDYGSPMYKVSSRQPSDHYSLQDNWMISPAMVNTLTGGYYITESYRAVDMGSFKWSDLGMGFPMPDPQTPFSMRTSLKGSYVDINAAYPFRYWNSSVEGRDTLSLQLRNHFLKGGVSIGKTQYTRKIINNAISSATGKWLGNDAADMLIGWPNSFTWTEPTYNPTAKYMIYTFLQDDWKLNSRLSLNLGLRWEPSYKAWVTNGHVLKFFPGTKSSVYPNFPDGVLTVGDPGFNGRSGFEDDINNFAPRLGVAYRMNSTGTRVIRGAWGLFYDGLTLAREAYDSVQAFPFIHSYSSSFSRGYPGQDGWVNWLPYEYPNKQPDLSKPLSPATAVFNSQVAYGLYAPSNNTGSIQQWNVTFEDQIRPQWMYSVSYQGHEGKGLGLRMFWNLPDQRDANDSWDVENMASRRPDQRYRYQQRIWWSPDVGGSRYHSLNLKLQARGSQFRLLTWYVLSHSNAQTNGGWDYYDRAHPTNLSLDWGPIQASRVHSLLAAPSWDIPFFRTRTDWVGRVMGGWNTTAVFNIQDGGPVNIVATSSNLTYQCANCFVRPNPTGQPFINANWSSDPNLVYVNAAAFSQPPPRTYGTQMQRNNLKWSYTKNTDLSVFKDIGLYGEKVKLQIRFDFFNLFNWVNWYVPETDIYLDSPTTLSMTNFWTTGSRTIQLGARITW